MERNEQEARKQHDKVTESRVDESVDSGLQPSEPEKKERKKAEDERKRSRSVESSMRHGLAISSSTKHLWNMALLWMFLEVVSLMLI